MVSLMDRLLKLENLDLHLTPYKVLATGQDEGMLEFIPSRSLAQVLYSIKDASPIREVQSQQIELNHFVLSTNLVAKICFCSS